MTKVTLDDIRAAAEQRYGSYDITLDNGFIVRLMNPLRLGEKARQKLMSMQDEVDEEHSAEALEDMIRTIAETSESADALIESLSGDLALMAVILEEYGKQTQAGEASPSQA